MMVDITQPLHHDWTRDPLTAAMARMMNPDAPNPYESGEPVCRHCWRVFSEKEDKHECSGRLRGIINTLLDDSE
jgi:hypothetical protein